jgi:secondary thiamine-phosphate synthase enzyme
VEACVIEKISIRTGKKEELINITADVQKAVARLKIKDGVCTIFAPHTTAAITINENADPDVVRDILSGLRRIVPETGYDHGEGNSPAHIKSSIIGCSGQVIVQDGRLVLGTWQGIYFCEFDGPRTRDVYIKGE